MKSKSALCMRVVGGIFLAGSWNCTAIVGVGDYKSGGEDTADASGGDDGGGGGDDGGDGCAASCPSGCCAADGSCVISTAQDWTACGAAGTACTACNKGALCTAGGCDNAHWAPNTMLTLTVTQLSVTAASCDDTFSTPDPYAAFVFDDPNPPRTALTGTCSSTTLCEPPNNEIHSVQASWLTDGKTTFSGWDANTLSSNYECWHDAYGFSAPLVVAASYTVPVAGYSSPGLVFALTAE